MPLRMETTVQTQMEMESRGCWCLGERQAGRQADNMAAHKQVVNGLWIVECS